MSKLYVNIKQVVQSNYNVNTITNLCSLPPVPDHSAWSPP